MKPALLFVSAGAAVLLLGGCGGPQVRSVGNGDGPPAYALRAETAAAVHGQAERLCPGGYRVLREAGSGTAAGDEAWDRALVTAGQWLAGEPFNEVQATIVCRG